MGPTKSTETRALDEPRVPTSTIEMLARILHQHGEINISRESTGSFITDRIRIGKKEIRMRTDLQSQRDCYPDTVMASLAQGLNEIAREVLA